MKLHLCAFDAGRQQGIVVGRTEMGVVAALAPICRRSWSDDLLADYGPEEYMGDYELVEAYFRPRIGHGDWKFDKLVELPTNDFAHVAAVSIAGKVSLFAEISLGELHRTVSDFWRRATGADKLPAASPNFINTGSGDSDTWYYMQSVALTPRS